MDEAVRVEGLQDLRKALRDADSKWPKELRLANKAAADLVAEGTRQSFLSRSGVAPKVAPSVKALAQQASAQVRIGGAQYPFVLGSEFGSVRFKQFPAWRGSDSGAGYSLYPTLRAKKDEIVETYAGAVDRLVSRAFPD